MASTRLSQQRGSQWKVRLKEYQETARTTTPPPITLQPSYLKLKQRSPTPFVYALSVIRNRRPSSCYRSIIIFQLIFLTSIAIKKKLYLTAKPWHTIPKKYPYGYAEDEKDFNTLAFYTINTNGQCSQTVSNTAF